MTDNPVPNYGWIKFLQQRRQPDQGLILLWRVALIIRPLQLDADTEVVAVTATGKAGSAGVPGAIRKRDELGNRTATGHQAMGGNLQMMNGGEVRMIVSRQRIAEKTLDIAPAEFPRWQADIVDHQQAYLFAGRAGIEIG